MGAQGVAERGDGEDDCVFCGEGVGCRGVEWWVVSATHGVGVGSLACWTDAVQCTRGDGSSACLMDAVARPPAPTNINYETLRKRVPRAPAPIRQTARRAAGCRLGRCAGRAHGAAHLLNVSISRDDQSDPLWQAFVSGVRARPDASDWVDWRRIFIVVSAQFTFIHKVLHLKQSLEGDS